MMRVPAFHERRSSPTRGSRFRPQTQRQPIHQFTNDVWRSHRSRSSKFVGAHRLPLGSGALSAETGQGCPPAFSGPRLGARLAYRSILAHVDFGAIPLVSNFIHQRVNQVYPAAVLGENVLLIRRARDLCRIKTFSWIANDDKD